MMLLSEFKLKSTSYICRECHNLQPQPDILQEFIVARLFFQCHATHLLKPTGALERCRQPVVEM